MDMSRILSSCSDNVSLGLENISFQKDTAIVDQLVTQMDVLKDRINTKKESKKELNSLSIFSDEKSKMVIYKIETLILNRFGINIKLVGTTGGAAIYPIPPKQGNNMFPAWNDEFFDYINKKGDSNVDVDKLKSAYDSKRMLGTIKKSVEAMSKSLQKGVTIDREKAYIKGLSKDYRPILMMPFVHLIDSVKLNGRQVVAIMLHEIGHAFTALEMTIIKSSELHTLSEDMIKTYEGKGRDALIIKLKVDNKMEDFKTETLTDRLIFTVNLIGKKSEEFKQNGNKDFNTETERVADQFATRFGMAPELATGLNQYIDASSRQITVFDMYNYYVYFSTVVAILVDAKSVIEIIARLGKFTMMAVLANTIFSIVLKILTSFFPKTYDDDKVRIHKLKIEQIRMLKQTTMETKDKKAIISSIEEIEKVYEKYNGFDFENTVIGDKVLSLINSGYNKERFSIVIEQIMNNDAYAAKTKLETLV